MKAAIYRKFGGPEVVHIEDVPKPEPKAGEVLIRVMATTVSVADHRVRSLDLPKGIGFVRPLVLGIFGPRIPILGMDASGIVEAVGPNVANYSHGDPVIALRGPKFGCHAEYVCMRADGPMALKPSNLGFEEAVALVFGGHTALKFLERARLKPGDRVLVNGASGAVGTAAVQIAKHRGAEVTGVCSAANADLVRSLGADQHIDYTRQDFADDGAVYDAVVDCVGNAPFERVKESIRPGGALLLVITDLKGMLGARRNSRRSGRLVTWADPKPSANDMAYLVRLAEEAVFRPVIDRTYSFDDIVAAHRYVDTGRKRGNVVVRIAVH